MARKEINIFNVSFLDLLSGALGAVLILFIVIPKLTSENVITISEIENLESRGSEIESLLNQLEESLPVEVLVQVQNQINNLREEIKKLNQEIGGVKNKVRSLQKKLAEYEKKISELSSEIIKITEENQMLNDKISELNLQIKKITEENQKLKENNEILNQKLKECNGKQDKCVKALKRSNFILIMIQWSTEKQDIDLWVTDPLGNKFYYGKKTHPGRPGQLSADTLRGPGTEVWQITGAPKGTYQVHYHLYSQHGNTEPAKILGRVFYRDGVEKIKNITLYNNGVLVKVLNFEVNSNGDVRFIHF